MSDYAERLRKYNRAAQVQYEWFEEVANHIEALEDASEKDRDYWYNQGFMDAVVDLDQKENMKMAKTSKQEDYSSDAGIIGVETIEEHEDGSATYQFHMDAHARGLLADEGLKLVLYCAAAKLDLQVIYDFIEDHIKYEQDQVVD